VTGGGGYLRGGVFDSKSFRGQLFEGGRAIIRGGWLIYRNGVYQISK
jgi:hypothetical protein